MKIKNIFLFVLMVALTTTVFGFKSNFSNNSVKAENTYKTNLSTEINDILTQDTKKPEDYVENGQAPDGSIVNDEMLSIIQNEAVMFYSENGSDSAKYAVTDKIYVNGTSGSSTPLRYAANNVATSYVAGVAFDGISNNPNGNKIVDRKSYGAFVGLKKIDGKTSLFMWTYDIRNGGVIATRNLGTATWYDNVSQFAYKNFMSITAGDFDGDGTENIAVLVSSDTEISVLVFKNAHLTLHEKYDLYDFVDTKTIDKKYFPSVTSNKVNRPIVSLTTGDFDGDDIKELAVAISSAKNRVVANKTSIANLATNIAIIKNPLQKIYSTIKKMHIAEKDNDTNTVLYYSQIAAGDINNDQLDEIVVAGYICNVFNNTSLYNYDQTNSVDTSNIGLLAISYNGIDYVRTKTTSCAMNKFIKSGFYAGDDIFNPLAVETAYINGTDCEESVFVSGTIYDFTTDIPVQKYVYSMFDKSKERGSNAYVESVVSGNFTNDDAGRESFVFVNSYKYMARNKYSYQFGYIGGTYEDDLDNSNVGFGKNKAFVDNSDNQYGHYIIDEQNGGIAESEKFGSTLVILAADCDEDGVKLKYTGTSFAYTDPEVKAVLQAAPYFSELGDGSVFSGSTSYSIQTSYGETTDDSISFSIGVGAYGEGKVGIVVDAKLRIQAGFGFSKTWGKTRSYTTTYSDTFQAAEYDTVVLQRLPLTEYHYSVWDQTTNDWSETKKVSVLVALKPVYYQISVDSYNKFVQTYNDIVKDNPSASTLKPINNTVMPMDALGNPYKYYSTLPSSGEIVSQTYALSYNAGSTTASTGNDYTYTSYSSSTKNIAGGASWSVEAGVLFAKISAGAFFELTLGWSSSTSQSISTGTSVTGSVANINPNDYDVSLESLEMFRFNWRLAVWKTSLMSNDEQIPVVGYILSNISSGGPEPVGISADLDYSNQKVTITWQQPSTQSNYDFLNYIVYRKIKDSHDLVVVGETNNLSFEEDYKNLKSGVIYTYLVGCVYNNNDDEVVSISRNGSDLVGGVGGHTDTETWKPISSLDEINGYGFYYLINDIETNSSVEISEIVYLDLNGYNIVGTMNDYLFKTITGGNLIITDSHLSSTITCSNNCSIIYNDGGSFNALGGIYNSHTYTIINKSGIVNINDGTFTVSVGAIVKNLENAQLNIYGGEFWGKGAEFSVGIENSGEFMLGGGEFNHFDCDIELHNSIITLTADGIKTKNYIHVTKYDEKNNAVAGVFTNKIPTLAENLAKYFIVSLPNSGVYVTPYGEIAICVHNFNSNTLVLAPDCENQGLMLYTCSNCNHSYSEAVSKLGHDYGEWKEEVAPTTQNYGVVAHYTCSHCNKNFDIDKKELHSIYIGKTGVSVVSIQKINSLNNKDIYQITFSDNTSTTFEIINGEKGEVGDVGNGIASISKISSNGITDNYEILFTNGTTTTFSVTNGQTGVGIEKVEKIYDDGQKQIIQITYTNGTTAQFELQTSNTKTIEILLYILIGLIALSIICVAVAVIVKKSKNKSQNEQQEQTEEQTEQKQQQDEQPENQNTDEN